VSPKSNIIMVIMVFSLLRNTVAIVKRKDKVKLSQGLALNTKNARAERAIQAIANLVPPDFDGNEGVQLTPNITPAPEGAHRRTRGNAFSMDPQLCSECSVRTYSFGISYQGTV